MRGGLPALDLPGMYSLECHPRSQRPAVRSLQVEVDCEGADALRLRFSLGAHVARLKVPPPAASESADELWRHTCFEAFISVADTPFYYELNLAPSSQWAFYRFGSYRNDMSVVALSRPPEIAVRRSEYRLDLDATLRFDELPELRGAPPLRLALAAVIEADDGSLSYWALKHPRGKPDFHKGVGFVPFARSEAPT